MFSHVFFPRYLGLLLLTGLPADGIYMLWDSNEHEQILSLSC